MLRPLQEVSLNVPIVDNTTIADTKLQVSLVKLLQEGLGDKGYTFGSFTSHAMTDKARGDKAANYAVFPNQYVIFASLMYEFSLELYKYVSIYEKLKGNHKELTGSAELIYENIYRNDLLKTHFESNDDITLFSKFMDKDKSEYRCGAKRPIADKGPRQGYDCFGSVILKVINLPDSSSSIFGRFVYELSSRSGLYYTLFEQLQASDISNKNIIISDKTIRNFVEKVITYIFDKQIQKTLLSALADRSSREEPHKDLVLEDSRIYSIFRVSESPLTEKELTSGTNVRYFLTPLDNNGQYLYLTNQWADNNGESKSSRDVTSFTNIFNKLYSKIQIEKSNGYYQLIKISAENNTYRKLPKPFLLLAGISGTGKTRFVREQVKASGSLSETYCLTSVRPDWHDPSDLLGYESRLKDRAKYVSTDVIEFIAKAWRAIIDSHLTVAEEPNEQGHNRLVVSGDIDSLSHINPYWLCLDEMNLAPVEQYFADYLSVIETRDWQWMGDDFTYSSDALLSASTISHPDYTDPLRKQLGFESDDYEDCWQLFKKYGISIPFNLIVAGTVNMDETTHGFSRKVIDRALSFDFGEFFPNDIDDFFESTKVAKSLSYPIYSQAKREQFNAVQADNNAQKTTAFFKAINEVLKGTAFELAFRAFNELCLAVISFAPKTDHELQAVFDDFLMCKVLPRIEGDEDKLASRNEGNLLEQLALVLESELKDIWQNQRPDLFRAYKDSADEKVVETDCRSYKKIEAMTAQLTSGFTSFWP